MLLAAVLLAACSEPAASFRCSDDAQCVSPAGAQGRCEATLDCSFADSSCASGWRYGAWAASSLTSSCVVVLAADAAVADAADPRDLGAADLGGSGAGSGDLAGSDLAGADLATACGGLLQPCCGGNVCSGTLACQAGLCNAL